MNTAQQAMISVSARGHWLFIVVCAPLLAFCSHLAVSAQPGTQLVPPGGIPGGSLARAYEQRELYLPGDINKPWLNVLVIEDSLHRPIGLRIAGHAPSAVCNEASRIVTDLAARLQELRLAYGPPVDSASDRFFYTYGLFLGPIGERYSSVYKPAIEGFRQLAQRDSEQVEINKILLSDYERHTAQLETGRQWLRQQTGPAVVLHMLPDSFWTVVRQNKVSKQSFWTLWDLSKQSISNDLPSNIIDDERLAQRIESEFLKFKYPFRYRIWYSEQPIRSYWGDSSIEAIRQLALRNPELRQQIDIWDAKIGDSYSYRGYFHDRQLNVLFSQYAGSFHQMLDPQRYVDSLLSQIQIIESQQLHVDSISFEWKVADRDAQPPFLKAYRASRFALACYIKQAFALHPFMLADAVTRGWPCLDARLYPNLYLEGRNFRVNSLLWSEYQFVAPANYRIQDSAIPEASVYTTVSGAVFQLIDSNGVEQFVPLHHAFEYDSTSHEWELSSQPIDKWFSAQTHGREKRWINPQTGVLEEMPLSVYEYYQKTIDLFNHRVQPE